MTINLNANYNVKYKIVLLIIEILKTNTTTITKPVILTQYKQLNINSISCNEIYNYIINYEYIYNFYEKYFNIF